MGLRFPHSLSYNPSSRGRSTIIGLVLDQGSAGGQVALIPGACLTADIGRADRDEPGFGQHLLGRDILAGGRRPEHAQPVLRRRQLAQFPYCRGRYAAARDSLGDPVAELCRVVLDVDQVEPAEYRARRCSSGTGLLYSDGALRPPEFPPGGLALANQAWQG